MGGIGPPVSCPTVGVGKAPVGPLSPQLQPPSAQVVDVHGLYSRLWFSFTSGPRTLPTAPEWMAGCGGRSYLLLLTLRAGVRTDVPWAYLTCLWALINQELEVGTLFLVPGRH